MPPNVIIQTSFLLPTSVISSNNFTNASNILLQDGNLAYSDIGGSSDIIVGNFLTNLPVDAVITGIEFNVTALRGSQTVPPITLQFDEYDNTGGANNYYPYVSVFSGLTETLATYSFGTSTYLFATAWTVDQINNFKLRISTNGYVGIDTVTLSILYYIPATVIPPTPAPGTCIDCDSPIQVQAMSLELPFLSGETKFYLKKGSFAYPNGTPVQPGDVGACGGSIPFVFDEGKKKADGNFEENAMLDTTLGSWSVLPSGVIEMDLGAVTQRGLDFKTPGTHVASLMSDHDANSKVIISNNEPYNLSLVRTCQVDTVFSPPINVESEGNDIVDPVHTFNFKGGGVSVIQDPMDPFQADITIPGSGTMPPAVVSSVSNSSLNVQVITLTLPGLDVSGINRGVVYQIATEKLATVVSVIGNGAENFVQQVVQVDNASNLRTEQWFLLAPTAGVMTIVVTLSQAAYISQGAEALAGVDQSTPIGSNSNDVGTSVAPSTTNVTTYDNSVIFDSLVTAQLPILYTVGGNQVVNWEETANPIARQGASSYELAGTAPDNVIMSWAITQNTKWCMTSLEVKGITATTTDEMVKVNLADTTTGFLDDKIELVPTSPNIVIVKTIQNPGANEKISYSIDSVAGGGGNNLLVDQTPDNGTYGLLAGTINGINTTFTVAAGSYITGLLSVFLNGLIQWQGGTEDFVETAPGAGTFSFNVAPIPGDVITAVYQTISGGFGAQAGIQFEDEGVALGSAGTVDELDFVGADVVATRVGNKVLVTITGGAGSVSVGEQHLDGVKTTGGGATSRHKSMTSDLTGDFLYITTRTGSNSAFGIDQYAKDANTGMYYLTGNDSSSGGDGVSSGNSMCVNGIYLYAFYQGTGGFANKLRCRRYLASDLSGGVQMTITGNPLAGNISSFADGTDLYVGKNGAAGTWDRYTIAGTTLTFASSYTGGLTTTTSAFLDPDSPTDVYMINSATNIVYKYTLGGATLTVASSQSFNFELSYQNDNLILGVGEIDSNSFYVGYDVYYNDETGGSNPIRFLQPLLKPFSKL